LAETSNDPSVNSSGKRPTMCRNCGSIVGGSQKQCAVCGAPVVDPAVRSTLPTPDRETLRFAKAILDRPYKFTVALLIANIFIFLLMWEAGGLANVFNFFSDEVLVAFGAKVNYLIREQRQWWRFVTPMFLHVNLIHLFVNMYSLWVVGPYVEKLYGAPKFVVFWVVSGIVALIASYFSVIPAGSRLGAGTGFLLKTVDVPSAGASGALFGLVGVLFVFGIKYRRELPEGFKRAFGTGLLPMILLNLFIGYVGRGLIDNAAHVGGLIAGAGLALVVHYRRPGESASIARIWQVLQVACIALVAIGFVKTVQHFRDPLPDFLLQRKALMQREATPATSGEPVDKFVDYARAMNRGQETLNVVLTKKDSSGVDAAIKELETVPQLDPKADELRKRFMEILVQAKAVTGQVEAQAPESQRKIVDDFMQWSGEYREWLKTTGRQYGLGEATEVESPR
jgi:membrane associated rhomboid family serine protease